MKNYEEEFCQKYVALFLIIINYSNDDGTNYIDNIENYRFESIEIIRSSSRSKESKEHDIKVVNSSYDNQIINHINNSIAAESPEVFNSVIIKINKLFKDYEQEAKRLKMIIPNSNSQIKIIDYYNNYKIAVKKLLDIDLMKKI